MDCNDPTNILFSATEELCLEYLSLGLCSIAILSCVIILFLILRRSEQLPSLFKTSSMVIFLAISDLSLCVFSITARSITSPCSGVFCKYQALANQFFEFSSFLWCMCICNSSYQSVLKLFSNSVNNNSHSHRDGYTSLSHHRGNQFYPIKINIPSNPDRNIMIVYHLISWGFPLLSVIIMLATFSNGYSGHACWLVTTSSSQSYQSVLPLWAAVLFYLIPLIMIQIFNMYVFRFLFKALRNIPFSKLLLSRFTRSISIVIALKFILLLNRSVLLLLPNHTHFALSVLEVTGYPLQALGDCIILTQHSSLSLVAATNTNTLDEAGLRSGENTSTSSPKSQRNAGACSDFPLLEGNEGCSRSDRNNNITDVDADADTRNILHCSNEL